MEFLPVMAAAMAISLMVIPLMVRYAAQFGFIDEPGPRKVHQYPVPRVGGTGIVLGALIPIGLALRGEPLMASYIFGSIVLALFGLWDDRKGLGHYAKFVGQLIAVIPVIYFGGLYITHLPLIADNAVPAALAKLFTVFALVGMINAMNHSDGLDGLAGGEALLSLGVLGFLFFLSGMDPALIVVMATVGGVFGFLRYNTHPADVFMGDSGSQFLGFTIGFLLVLLTQRADTSLSPSVVLLIVGLPIADILVVWWKRASSGRNWFHATRNHVHHRLLHLGFKHHEAVAIIYAIQLLFVAAAIALRHSPDHQVLAAYVGACLLLFGGLGLAERRGFQFNPIWRTRHSSTEIDSRLFHWRVVMPRRLLEYGIPLYLILASMRTRDIPPDATVIAGILFMLMLFARWRDLRLRRQIRSALVFASALFVIYLSADYLHMSHYVVTGDALALIIFSLATVVAVRYSPRRRLREFVPTATDFLIVIVLILGIIAQGGLLQNGVPRFAGMALATAVIFYGCELVITERREYRDMLDPGILVAMGILAVKGIMLL